MIDNSSSYLKLFFYKTSVKFVSIKMVCTFMQFLHSYSFYNYYYIKFLRNKTKIPISISRKFHLWNLNFKFSEIRISLKLTLQKYFPQTLKRLLTACFPTWSSVLYHTLLYFSPQRVEWGTFQFSRRHRNQLIPQSHHTRLQNHTVCLISSCNSAIKTQL